MHIPRSRPRARVALAFSLTLLTSRSIHAEDTGLRDAGRVQLLVRADGGAVQAVDLLPPQYGIVGVMGDGVEGAGAETPASVPDARPPAPTPSDVRGYRRVSLRDALKQWQVSRAQRALLNAHLQLSAKQPPKPAELSLRGIRGWLDGPVTSWLNERRTLHLKAAEDAYARGLDDQLLVAARGVIGEDTAAVYFAAPVPKELRDDAELSEIFRSQTALVAVSMMRSMGTAYEQCSSGPSEKVAAFCKRRREHLRQVFRF